MAAEDAREEFLVDALENEAVAEAAEERDPDAETATVGDLSAALDASEEALDNLDLIEGFADETSNNIREAKITDALEAAQDDIEEAETDLANAQQAFQAAANDAQKSRAVQYEAAARKLEATKATRDSAYADAEAERDAFVAAQAEKDVTIDVSDAQTISIESGATLAVFQEFAEGVSDIDGAGRFVVTSSGMGYEGLQEVVDVINEALVASDAVHPAREDRNEARDAILDGTEAGDLYNQVIGAGETLSDAEDAQVALEAAIADYRELAELNDQYDALVKAVNDAKGAITNAEDADPAGLGVNLTAGEDFTGELTATPDDDVYLFSDSEENAITITDFGNSGDDSIYFGSDFELVALGDNEITGRVGAADQLEIFWAQDGDNLNLFVENHVEAGRETSADNITQITLNGVSAEDVSLEGGFLTVA